MDSVDARSRHQAAIAGGTAPREFPIRFSKSHDGSAGEPSLRVNGSRECAPDDRLRDSRAPAVIASVAKQSILPRKERMDCFAALAMTASPDAISRPRRAMRPRFCVYLSPKEGVGNAGCPLHPRPRVHLVVVERTRVTTSTPESPGIPARNGFNGFLRALPGDRALLPPSPTDMFLSKPGWADSNTANLTPASGVRTTRLRRTLQHLSSARLVIAHRPFANPPCNPVARKTLPRPPHSTPRP